MQRRHWIDQGTLLLGALFLATGAPAAQRVKRSGFAQDLVFEFALGPDSTSVVYSHVPGLSSARVDGSGAPVRLFDASADRYCRAMVFSGDSRRVAFIDSGVGVGDRLFSAPLDGATPTIELDGRTDQTIFYLVVDSAGRRLVYPTESRSLPRIPGLYSVPIDGSEPPTLLAGPHSSSFVCSPVGNEVVYFSDERIAGTFELFVEPVTGGVPLRLSQDLPPNRDVHLVAMDPTGRRAVYEADFVRDGQEELFSVPLDRNVEPVKLSGTMPAFARVFDFKISLDGTRVVYRSDKERNDVYELYSAPIDGHRPEIKLNPTLTAGTVWDFQFPPPHGPLTYMIQGPLTSGGHVKLFAVDVDGGPSVRLDDEPESGSVGVFTTYSQDGKRIVFAASSGLSSPYELMVAPLDGARPPLSLAPGQSVDGMATARGDRVVFTESSSEGEIVQLFSVPLDGTELPVALDPLTPYVGTQWRVTPDGARVVYEYGQLYSVPSDGSRARVRLNE